jgi:hypothetical protein
LDEPRRPGCGDAAEVPTRFRIPVGLLELRLIPDVEHLCPELQSRCFASQGKKLLYAQVPVINTRTTEDRGSAIAEVTAQISAAIERISQENARLGLMLARYANNYASSRIFDAVKAEARSQSTS